MLWPMLIRLILSTLLFLSALASAQQQTTTLIRNVVIYDGTGGKPFRGEVRVIADRIQAVAPKLKPQTGEATIDGRGMALAPGFIDMHSHADRGIFEKPHGAVVRQGITTVLVGQDGGSEFPLREFFAKLDKQPAAMNVASMVGHASVREQVMGKDLYRAATPQEIDRMFTVLHQEMSAGAMGMSTGLEYEEGHFATTDEVALLAKMAAGHDGFYNSHVRDEGNHAFDSFDEVIEIGRRAKIPVVITHIKLASPAVWDQAAAKMPAMFQKAAAAGVDLKADVYPYTFWQSTLRVLVLDRDWFNPVKAKKGLDDNGTPAHLRISRYEPDPTVEGKTLEQIAALWKMSPVDAYMKMIRATLPDANGKSAEEGVIGESMTETDVKWFIAHPRIMFSTDGELEGRHPRGAGAFPRVLGRYVREQKVLPLEAAIRKMTSLPAAQLGLTERGRIAPGMMADLVLFDLKTVIDRSTLEDPLAAPAGIADVMVNGRWVVKDGALTAERPGKALRKPQAAAVTNSAR
jgi:N-acyl-D-amino-acid deacylase